MNTEERIKEIKQSIKHYKGLLKDANCDFQTQTWIELQLQELRKEMRAIKKSTQP